MRNDGDEKRVQLRDGLANMEGSVAVGDTYAGFLCGVFANGFTVCRVASGVLAMLTKSHALAGGICRR